MAEDTPDAPGPSTPAVDGPGAVVTPDGAEHVGVVPASAAVPSVEERRAARTGWFKSPSGTVMHADGPDQKRAFADRGWEEITEDQAKDIVATGAQLVLDRRDSRGTFDADAVARAVRDEAGPDPKRSAAARKGAETKRRKKAEAQADADGTTASD